MLVTDELLEWLSDGVSDVWAPPAPTACLIDQERWTMEGRWGTDKEKAARAKQAHIEAQELCNKCPFSKQCLEAATQQSSTFGVWGGVVVTSNSGARIMCKEGRHHLGEVGVVPGTMAGCKACKEDDQKKRAANQRLHRERKARERSGTPAE